MKEPASKASLEEVIFPRFRFVFLGTQVSHKVTAKGKSGALAKRPVMIADAKIGWGCSRDALTPMIGIHLMDKGGNHG